MTTPIDIEKYNLNKKQLEHLKKYFEIPRTIKKGKSFVSWVALHKDKKLIGHMRKTVFDYQLEKIR